MAVHLLPSTGSLRLFYQIASVLAVITAASVVIVMRNARRVPPEAPDPTDAPATARRWLLQGLGALWLLDGLLQAQPFMVTRFIGGFLAPLLAGQPAPVAALIGWGIKVWELNPVLWNVAATFIQIGIGLALILGRPAFGRRIGLWASVIWGGVVWIAGEGLGGVFVGGGWLTGAPGSALFYVLLAAFLLAPEQWWRHPRSGRTFSYVIAGVWGLEAVLQAWPRAGWWTVSGLKGYVWSMAQMPQPGLVSAPLYAWASSLGQHPVAWNGVLVALLLTFAVLWFKWPHRRRVWWLTALWVFSTWWVGQDFGVLGGMGTDPNTGAVLGLMLIVYGRLTGVFPIPRRVPVDKASPLAEHGKAIK